MHNPAACELSSKLPTRGLYIGGHMEGGYYRGINGDTRSLDYGSCRVPTSTWDCDLKASAIILQIDKGMVLGSFCG